MKKFKILALVMTCAILLSSLMIIPVSADGAAETNVAADVYGKKITIDGVADTDEGWDEATPIYLSYFTTDPYATTATEATSVGSFVKYATDGEYLYIYYQTTNLGTVSADIPWWATTIDLYFSPVDTYLDALTEEGIGFRLRVRLGSNYVFKDGKETAYFSDDRTIGGSGVTLVQNFAYNGSTTITDTEYLENTEIVARANRNGSTIESKTVEAKIPLAESVKEQLAAGDVVYKIGAHEKTGYAENTTEFTSNGSGNYGYVTQSARMLDSSNLIITNAVSVTLPKIEKTAPVLVGFQSQINDDGTYDVRFVSVVNEYEGFTLANSKLGYNFTYGGKNDTKNCTKVYETLNANGSEIKATDFGGKYFFCFTIKGLSQTEATGYTFGVACFTQKDAQATVETCANPVTVTVKYNSTTQTVDFTY